VDDNLKESALFTYSTKDLTKTDKVKFHYSLKGRNGTPGLLEKVNGTHVGSAVILVPKEFEGHVEQFFAKWNIPFEKQSVIIKNGQEK
jgi:hypothetical protein